MVAAKEESSRKLEEKRLEERRKAQEARRLGIH